MRGCCHQFDLGFGLEIVELFLQVLLLQLLGQIGFDLLQRRGLHRLGVFQQDDVVAKLRLHGFLCELALFELADGGAELGHHPAQIKPAEITATGFGAGVFGFFHRQFGEGAGILLEPGDDVLRLGLLLDQDMARLVFAARDRGLDALVLGFQRLVGDRIVLDEILHVGVGQNRLPDQFHALGHLGRFVQPLLDRLFGDHHLHGQLVNDGISGFCVIGLAGTGALFDQHIDAVLAYHRAIDCGHGRVQRGCCRRLCVLFRLACHERQQGRCADDEKYGFH